MRRASRTARPPTHNVFDPSKANPGLTISEDGLSITNTTGNDGYRTALGTVGRTSGKPFFEAVSGGQSVTYYGSGEADTYLYDNLPLGRVPEVESFSMQYDFHWWHNNSIQKPLPRTFAVIGLGFDFAAGVVHYYSDGVLVANDLIFDPTTEQFPGGCLFSFGDTLTFNFGQEPFVYGPPAGFEPGWVSI